MPDALTRRTLLPADRWPTHTLTGHDGLRLVLHSDGRLRGIWHHGLLVSRLLADPLQGGATRLYLRLHREDGVTATEVVGPNAGSAFAGDHNAAHWAGHVDKPNGRVAYRVQLRPVPNQTWWRWDVHVENEPADEGTTDVAQWDAILVQDLALAAEGTTRNNEKYVSQYLDHRVATHAAHGPVVLSRQALAQAHGTHPWLLGASLPRAAGALTDALGFYGTTHKADGVAALATTPTLPTKATQHESAAVVLQSAPQPLTPGVSHSATFAFAFVPDHPDASSDADLVLLDRVAATLSRNTAPSALENKTRHGAPPESTVFRPGDPATTADLESWFGPRDAWRHVETAPGNPETTWSFFHGPDRHVATANKEAELRRGHGHILRTGRGWLPNDRTVGVTAYQDGVFGSQFTLGNTTFGQLTGVARDAINLNPLAGLRLAVELDADDGNARFAQLTVASAFELAPGWCRWWYRLGDRVLTVRAVASPDAPLLRYEAAVISGAPLRFRFTQHLSLGQGEDDKPTTLTLDPERGTATATPDPGTVLAQQFPGARCVVAFDAPSDLQTLDAVPLPIDRSENHDADRLPYLLAETARVSKLCWSFSASPDDAGMPDTLAVESDRLAADADAYWKGLRAPLEHELNDADISDRLTDVVPWFVHNAVIHLSVPHGLEQFGGAAWGTRDVCQGSVELLRAIEQPEVIADILRVVFRHQHRQTGDWPQWFMHEPFANIQAGDSHGDVVVWPLYALCHYLEMTGDAALLDESVGYTEADRDAGFPYSAPEHDAPIRAHAKRAIDRIVAQRLPGTTLPRYGHGDWNDSLQPAEPWMADRMVSSWTVALLQHTLSRLAECVAAVDPSWADELAQHAAAVADDFRKWCVVATPDGDEQAAGILLFSEDFSKAEPLLHPADTRTGILHSLIPMNRGLLAGLFDEAQAERHRGVIRNELLAPDGVRLMERPPTYTGGKSRFFQRAESAAFFGREIGLMYTHAHLRYAEAVLESGDADRALDLLNLVNPVGITGSTDTPGIPNAAPRQANAYFSSSDARFATRYEADAEHHRVFDGTVTVDGGWRIYSSGPGIFLHLLRRAVEAGSAVAAARRTA